MKPEDFNNKVAYFDDVLPDQVFQKIIHEYFQTPMTFVGDISGSAGYTTKPTNWGVGATLFLQGGSGGAAWVGCDTLAAGCSAAMGREGGRDQMGSRQPGAGSGLLVLSLDCGCGSASAPGLPCPCATSGG